MTGISIKPEPDPEMVEAVRMARVSAPTARIINPEIVAALINFRAAQLIVAKLDQLTKPGGF